MTPSETIRNLYMLIEPLGAGGMGIVYRAFDRLKSMPVAVKRVVVPPELLDFMARGSGDDYFLGLAKEFEVLASLRHPNIIAVYDYGFDQQKQPFLVMELIERAEELTQPSESLVLEQKVDVLLQMFEALDYLHRRGVIHRDLKPSNVLMSRAEEQGYRVWVLDFGLSLREEEREQDGEAVGTLNYMAPEVLQGGQVSVAADLYAGGVIAYELLTGQHPFDGDSLDDVIESILSKTIDFDALDLPEALRGILRRLMSRNPADRYRTSWEAMSALSEVIHRQRVESAAVRESFIQAAAFVGREAELQQLRAALEQAAVGKGNAWLVGGESGSGKTRLLEELRIRALVNGVQVIRGQAVAEDTSLYPLWRDVLRRLVLTTEISDLEASILKPFVRDIAGILERPVEDPAELPSGEGLRRLALTISDVLRRSSEPLLIILEDLHWAGQSQELIRQVCNQLVDMRVMLIGSYRNDEAPDLPKNLDSLNALSLGRLTSADVMTLSEKMIGEAARVPGVKELIAKETEGNVFFIVEVVRALAEESGRLQDIGRVTLPERVFSGGIRAVIRRRLERVPESGRKLLSLAAISGRQVDPVILRRLLEQHPDYLAGIDLDHWLVACSDAAVLSIFDGQWRFAHDKLREAVLADVTEAESPVLNRHVAEAIEATVTDVKPYAARLALHWRAAGDRAKELGYAAMAGEAAYLTSANAESVAHFSRALTILRETPELDQGDLKQDLTIQLAKGYARLNQFEDARKLLTADFMVMGSRKGDVVAELGRIALYQGDFAEAEKRLLESLTIFREGGAEADAARAQASLGRVYTRQGHYDQAEQTFRESLRRLTDTGDAWTRAQVLGGLGNVVGLRGDFAEAIQQLEAALDLYRAIGNREGMAGQLMDLGTIALTQEDMARAADLFRQSQTLYGEIEDQWGMAACLNNLGFIGLQQRDFKSAEYYFGQSLAILQTIDDRASIANMMNNLGHVAVGLTNIAQALDYFQQSLRDAVELGAEPIALEALVGIASVYAKQDKDDAALELLGVAISHPASSPEIRGLADPIREDIQTRRSEADVTAALDKAAGIDLTELAGRVLGTSAD